MEEDAKGERATMGRENAEVVRGSYSSSGKRAKLHIPGAASPIWRPSRRACLRLLIATDDEEVLIYVLNKA